jgi:Pvc16 N-terminal domain
MLTELHEVVKDLIYREGKIDRAEVEVAFEVPTRDFVERLVRPTLDVFLVELQENTELRQPQFRPAPAPDGKARFEALPRRVDLRYVVTALTTNAEDGFRLIWRVLGVLMRTPELPTDDLPRALTHDLPILARVARPDDSAKLLDVWSAVGGDPRPAFGYVLTAPMDLGLSLEAPLVLRGTLGFHGLTRLTDERPQPETRAIPRAKPADVIPVTPG